jgi:hypothetical protein
MKSEAAFSEAKQLLKDTGLMGVPGTIGISVAAMILIPFLRKFGCEQRSLEAFDFEGCESRSSEINA